MAKATSGINAVHGSLSVGEIPLEMFSSQVPRGEGTAVMFSYSGLHYRKGKDELIDKREVKLTSYYEAVDKLVAKFKPNQFQISLGFPLIVTVTFTWNT